jgi:cysteine synthase
MSIARHFAARKLRLPTFAELRDPKLIPRSITEALKDVDPDSADPLNLFRVHWHNDSDRMGLRDVPEYMELPSSLTGVDAKIIVALGKNFPMINAHKVLAAYACLVPRLMDGSFDPTRHRAIWPSTGNYCRGGVAISRLMDVRSVAVLPEGMSQERFDWLERWVTDPEKDVVRTYGTESNVKEIYDACNAMETDVGNVIFNQFKEMGNYVGHTAVTAPALCKVFADVQARHADTPLTAAAFVSASGSAGTLGTGDALKEKLGARIVAVEALECPTMLKNGFGEHNIQGIGDKHVPFIHNAMNTDFAVGISDEGPDTLSLLFNTEQGQRFMQERKGVDPETAERLGALGFSGICNVLAAIKTAKYLGLGADQAILTVGTDGVELYESEVAHFKSTRFKGSGFDELDAAEAWGAFLGGGARTDHVEELGHAGRERLFNLGYYTWVEQQGVSVEDFMARKDQAWWAEWRSRADDWDAQIESFNAATEAAAHVEMAA